MKRIAVLLCILSLSIFSLVGTASAFPPFHFPSSNEGPNEPGEIPEDWIPWDIDVPAISPCELGIGGDGCTIGIGGIGMPGPDIKPGIWFVVYNEDVYNQPDYSSCDEVFTNDCGNIW